VEYEGILFIYHWYGCTTCNDPDTQHPHFKRTYSRIYEQTLKQEELLELAYKRSGKKWQLKHSVLQIVVAKTYRCCPTSWGTVICFSAGMSMSSSPWFAQTWKLENTSGTLTSHRTTPIFVHTYYWPSNSSA
jgi:hypothetical protein